MPAYRPNVAAILQKAGGEILVAERTDVAGAWQFPQGGVDKGEGEQEALRRELAEEIGLQPEHYVILGFRSGYRYDYPPAVAKKKRSKHGYSGQEQTYFLCRFVGTDEDIVLDGDDHQEFGRVRWIRPEEFEEGWLPRFKAEVYRQVLEDFFDVRI